MNDFIEFTYDGYSRLIELLISNGYTFEGFEVDDEKLPRVMLRHDIDYDIEKTIRIAEIEHSHGVHSTFFVMVTSGFYNIMSPQTLSVLKRLVELGHGIGLHFDEKAYSLREDNYGMLATQVRKEVEVLEMATGVAIRSVSMHRPSNWILNSNASFPGLINVYSEKYMREYKYISDSRRCWREPIIPIIESGLYNKLHILTHAFWYNEKEISLKESVELFIARGNVDRTDLLRDNITDLDSIVN